MDANANSDTPDGTFQKAFKTISEGLAAATECVRVRQGTYRELLTASPAHVLDVFGVDGAQYTTVDGTGLGGSVLSATRGASMTLTGFTLTGGGGTEGHQNVDGDNFDTYNGGAVYLVASTLDIKDSVITANVLPGYLTPSAGVGRNSFGGGIFASGGKLTLEGVTITSNYAVNGGAIQASAANLEATHVTIKQNSAVYGPALGLDTSATATLTNTLVAENTGTVSGGISVTGATLSLINTTFQDAYEGIMLDDAYGVNHVSLDSSILWSSQSGIWEIDGSSTVFDAKYSDVYAGNEAWIGLTDPTGTNGMLSQDPGLHFDYTLADGSPCIDSGDPALRDADGSGPEMGAWGGPGSIW